MRAALAFALVGAVAGAFDGGVNLDPVMDCVFDAPFSATKTTLTLPEFVALDSLIREKPLFNSNLEKAGYAASSSLWDEFGGAKGFMDRSDVVAMMGKLAEGDGGHQSERMVRIAYKMMRAHICPYRG